MRTEHEKIEERQLVQMAQQQQQQSKKLDSFPVEYEEHVGTIPPAALSVLEAKKEVKNQDFVMCSFLEYAYRISSPRYFSYSARLSSFSYWPLQMHQRKEEMARVGFFSTKRGDEVSCFACGLTIWDWPSSVTPFEAHYWLNDECRYLASIPSNLPT